MKRFLLSLAVAGLGLSASATDIEIALNTNPDNWMPSKGASLTESKVTHDGITFNFNATSAVYYNTGYLMINSNNTLEVTMPENFECTSIKAQLNDKGSPSTKANLEITSGETTICDAQTLSSMGFVATYNIPADYQTAGSTYGLKVTNKNAQLINLTFTGEYKQDLPAVNHINSVKLGETMAVEEEGMYILMGDIFEGKTATVTVDFEEGYNLWYAVQAEGADVGPMTLAEGDATNAPEGFTLATSNEIEIPVGMAYLALYTEKDGKFPEEPMVVACSIQSAHPDGFLPVTRVSFNGTPAEFDSANGSYFVSGIISEGETADINVEGAEGYNLWYYVIDGATPFAETETPEGLEGFTKLTDGKITVNAGQGQIGIFAEADGTAYLDYPVAIDYYFEAQSAEATSGINAIRIGNLTATKTYDEDEERTIYMMEEVVNVTSGREITIEVDLADGYELYYLDLGGIAMSIEEEEQPSEGNGLPEEYAGFTKAENGIIKLTLNGSPTGEDNKEMAGVQLALITGKDGKFSMPEMFAATALLNDLTSVSEILGDEGEATWYDLEGRRIDNPGNGLYIVVKGGKSAKVLISK